MKLRKLSPNWPRDIAAGLTLAAIGIPEVMGYTKIIGTPVITGLYTLVLPVLAFALLGSSRHLVIGADSATAAIIAGELLTGSHLAPENYLAMTSLIAGLVGLWLLIARIFDLGFIAKFLSRTVLIGFLSGVGVQVAFSELGGMLGIKTTVHGTLPKFIELTRHFATLHWPTVVCSGVALLICIGTKYCHTRLPGSLLAVIGAILYSSFYDMAAWGIELLGTIPSGLPRWTWPETSLAELSSLVPISVSCFVVIVAQSAATARAYAMKYNESVDENKDLIGLSLGNWAALISGTFVVNGSPTKTAIVDEAGGRSQLAQLTMALVVVIVLLFFTGPLETLPRCVLATLVFLIGLKLIDIRGLKAIFKISPVEFWLALLTAFIVIVFGVEQGILLSVSLSLFIHLRRSYQPLSSIERPSPKVIIYWFGSDLFFANIEQFTNEILRLAQERPLWIAVDGTAITAADYSATQEVLNLQKKLSQQNIQLVWFGFPTEACNILIQTLGIAGPAYFSNRELCLIAFKDRSARLQSDPSQ